MTTEHSSLTGASLHEPKGVASATANYVYVADGIGSGSWTTVGLSSLNSTAKSFEAQLLHVQDQKASGTNGGTFSSGAWRTRTLNTALTSEISGASLASNQITLPAGTYFCLAAVGGNSVTDHKAKLRNVTDGTDALIGQNTTAGTGSTTHTFVQGRFTIASAKTFELQHWGATTVSTDGFGRALSAGVVEVYADVKIWKVA